MCGITGFWTTPNHLKESITEWGESMCATLRHRGPDDGGLWADPAGGLVLGSRRLAIQDLSPAGHMPMRSHCGRYVIVYNGEIYNFLEIRKELEREGHRFTGGSDTEVLINGCATWGLQACLKKLNGMFSFALWDQQERTLAMARDRLGVKPLFYGWSRQTFLFGSELKALHAHPHFVKTLDRRSLTLFIRLGYIPAPHSIYEGIQKLPPGHFMLLKDPSERAAPEPYWDAKRLAQAGTERRFKGDFGEASDALETLLRDSIRLRMLADVPVGAFLSGGIDSSIVVALMQAQKTSRVKTFTIGFNEQNYNEAHYSEDVAKHLGTDHTALYVSSDAAQEVIPKLPYIYDEPFADPSQIPTLLVSQLAREEVTVSLSGDGGDELFGGYREYVYGIQRWRVLRRLGPLSGLLSRGLSDLRGMTSVRARKFARMLSIQSPEGMHHYNVSRWRSPTEVVVGGAEHCTPFTDPRLWAPAISDVERMMYMDIVTYLPEDILTKVDRASMAVSLEARVPLLDYRIVEFAWSLPLEFKLVEPQGKRILRSLLARYLPPKLFERPKMGFDLPLAQWLRGPLRQWAEALLNASELQRQGVLKPAPIVEAWEEHLSGRSDRTKQLWPILMFCAWNEEWKCV